MMSELLAEMNHVREKGCERAPSCDNPKLQSNIDLYMLSDIMHTQGFLLQHPFDGHLKRFRTPARLLQQVLKSGVVDSALSIFKCIIRTTPPL